MDRQIVYNGQLPLETDVLNTNLFAMIGLGRLAMDVLGASTTVSGLACTPSTPASMSVKIGAGAIYSLQNVDNSAYSSLPANTVDQIVKQGILETSDDLSLAMTAPVTAGYSVIYLIQAAYQDTDSGNAVLNYYDSLNPEVPFTGPNNNNSSQPTIRAGKISISAKPGIPAASPTAPSADAGYVPLYTVTIAYGQTTIVSGNIATASGAPFLAGNLASFANYLTTAAAASTYATIATTAGKAPLPTSNGAVAGAWIALVTTGTTISTPPGGTWAYFYINNNTGSLGVQAGGTTVFTGTINNFAGFAWRIA